MPASLTPYLFFNGRCDEAVDFYKTAVGAEVDMVMRFDESPEPMPEGAIPPDFGQKVMHGSIRVHGHRIMVSDGCETGSNFAGFRLALSLATEAEARRAFDALAEGGTVDMPLTATFWSPCYGMVTDKFGVGWMVIVVEEG